MRAFVSQVKEVCDTLASCGSPISDMEKIVTILNGLPGEYQPFVVVITANLIHWMNQLLHDDVIVPSSVTTIVAGNGSQACDDRDGVCDNSHVIDDHLVESAGGASLDELPLASEEFGAIVNLVVEHEDSSIHEASRTSSSCLPIGEFQFVGEVHGADMLEGSLPHEGTLDPDSHAIDPNHIDTCDEIPTVYCLQNCHPMITRRKKGI
ncbi:hypothetical protein GQ457_01G029790 [Hibiscus cannabinus]